jgi:hypothetical protein
MGGDSLGAQVYRAPKVLRRRKEFVYGKDDEKPIEPNLSDTGVELHKVKSFRKYSETFSSTCIKYLF